MDIVKECPKTKIMKINLNKKNTHNYSDLILDVSSSFL